MDVNNRDFIEQVRVMYEADPGYVSSIPFWKLEGMLARSRTCRMTSGSSACLYAVDGDRLVFYWSDNKETFLLPLEQVRALSFLVLHEEFFKLIQDQLDGYESTETYTLFYDLPPNGSSPRVLPPEDKSRLQPMAAGYSVAEFCFDGDEDYEALADLIRETDSHYRLTGNAVRDWTRSPAFAPTLWLWAVERDSGRPVGAAVSNYDPRLKETDLDWFYVLPPYQGKGIGRMLVGETISRSRERSSVIRLSGVADEFYVKCGFRRKDRWFIARRSS
ncbi:MAG: N-acetyltransferase family protein [Bacillota bacterium]